MGTDLRLGVPAVVAWAVGYVLTGAPPAAGWTAAAAWVTAAAILLALLRSRRSPRMLPTVGLAVAAVALVSTACFGMGHLRHPPGLATDGPRSGTAEIVITGTPSEASTGFFASSEPAPLASPSPSPSLADANAKAGTGAGASAAVGHGADAAVHAAMGPRNATGAGEGARAEPQRVKVAGELVGFSASRATTNARAPVLVFATVDDPAALRIGATLTLTGSLLAKPPGESVEFLFFGRGQAEVTAGAPWYLSWAGEVRSAFRAAAAPLPGDGAQLLTGLAIGDDSQVTDDLKDAMIVSGLTHLTAVSGANCAVIVACVMLVGGALGLGRRARVIVSIGVLLLFVTVVTPEPSVLRAATMAVIVLVALALGRPAAGIPPLCLSIVMLLALDPWLARSAGFALSVLATGGLLLLTRPLASVAERVLPRWLALAVAVPVAAQLACQPVLFLLAPQLTPYTVPANLLAEPAAALVSILGLVVCLLAIPLPGLAAALIWLPWAPSAWIGAVARFFAAAPGAAVPLPDGTLAAAAAVVLTALALLALLGRHAHPLLSRASGAVALVSALLLAATTGGGLIAQARAVPPDWQLAACDIGQGDAVLVRSRGITALVDVGPDPEPLAACLDQLAIPTIDLLVLTHYDRDHVGGLDAVVGRVDRALVGPPDGPADERMLTRLRAAGADIVPAARGQSGQLGDYRWDVLWPRPSTPLRGNDASVTLLFTGPLRMLFLGDLGEQAQQAVRAANRLGRVDVVKVAHHGSADQSEQLYLDVHAMVGIISVGADNTYGHPTDRLLGVLGRAGTRPFRTDLGGLTTVSGTAAHLTLWSSRAPP